MLLDKNLYEIISVYNISYKTPTGPKPLRIRFDKKMDLLYLLMVKLILILFLILLLTLLILILILILLKLILFDYGLFNKICDKIKDLISKKSGITNIHNFGKIRIDSYNSLPI